MLFLLSTSPHFSQVTMLQSECTFQTFKSENGTPLASLRCHVCAETGARYNLWSEIQQAFEVNDILFLNKYGLVPFMIDQNGEL